MGRVGVQRVELPRDARHLAVPGVEEQIQTWFARAERNAAAARSRQRHRPGRRDRRDRAIGQMRAHRRVPGQQARHLSRQDLPELPDRRVALLGHVQPPQPALAVDHVQRGRVRDLPALDRRLDAVDVPHMPQLAERPRQKLPFAGQAMELRVAEHVVDRGRLRVGVDPQQLHLLPGRAEHPLGVEHRGRRQRTDRRALRIVEVQQRHLPVKRTQRHRTSGLVRQREPRGGTTRQHRARVQRGVERQRVRRRRGPGQEPDYQYRGQRRRPDQRRQRRPPPRPRSAGAGMGCDRGRHRPVERQRRRPGARECEQTGEPRATTTRRLVRRPPGTGDSRTEPEAAELSQRNHEHDQTEHDRRGHRDHLICGAPRPRASGRRGA